jgi:glycosyltransferase involved in cell wall biosynthesis
VKLLIQIACFNEERTIAETLRDLPRRVPGCDAVEIVIIDDGSTDSTIAAAIAAGATHVVRLNGNQGYAAAVLAGLDACVRLGADVIVNTDGDNQYVGEDVAKLVEPILAGTADLVVGARPISHIKHFSLLKRALQKLGSSVVRSLSGTNVQDAPSGFRAMTRDAALRLNAFNGFSSTLETLVQAGRSNLRVVNVPIRVNPPTRDSRLARNMLHYLYRSTRAIIGAYLIYRPVKVFLSLAMLLLVPGAFLAARFLWLKATGSTGAHVQSVVASGVLAVCGVFMLGLAVLAHLLAINRKLLEEVRYTLRTRDVDRSPESGRHGVLEIKTLINEFPPRRSTPEQVASARDA